jgi:hypothetical protein
MKKAVTKTLLGLSIFALAATVWCQPAAATSFSIVGVEDSALTALVDFNYGGGVIDIGITNNSPFDARLTAFAFNVPDAVTGLSGFTGPTGWNSHFTVDGINSPGQYGFFDVAAITGPNFNGGSPNDGIPPSNTFSFSFTLTGDLTGLSTDSFLNQLSAAGPGQPDPQWFIGRFQRTGEFGQGSDVAIPGNGGGVPPIPEPATMLLVGAGLGLAGLRKKIAG